MFMYFGIVYIQFLNRAYQLNEVVAKYNKMVTPNCSFCNTECEIYVHVFLDCPLSFPIWTALQEFCMNNVTDEELTQGTCLLSDFKCSLVVITVRNSSYGKVMFSQACSRILSIGGGVHPPGHTHTLDTPGHTL